MAGLGKMPNTISHPVYLIPLGHGGDNTKKLIFPTSTLELKKSFLENVTCKLLYFVLNTYINIPRVTLM